MITTTGLTKRFQQNEVLTNIDLHVDAKDIVVLLGPSGSGKSTFFALSEWTRRVVRRTDRSERHCG